jgi:GDP-L-fucose synthase
MRLLITGARGMVGSNLVRGLSDAHEVHAPGRDTFDLLDARSVQETVARIAPDLVVHAAGRVGGIAANAAANALFLYENTMMGLNLLEAARLAGVPRVLNLGSSCIYPKDREEQLQESDLHTGPLEPTNEGYAVAKIAVLKYAAMLRNDDPRCDYKTAIPCNLYGPGDHFEPPRSHMVPSAIRKVDDARRNGSGEVEIWGDGTARREFMYVGDLVDFVAHAIERWDTLPPLVNVGLGHDYTINEYYAEIADVVGWDGEFVHDTSKLVGMKRKLLSVDLASEWGWKAPTSLADGLRLTYEHYLEMAR